MNDQKRRMAVRSFLSMAIALQLGAAWAEDVTTEQTAQSGRSNSLETVIVTGNLSGRQRTVTESLSPIDVITERELLSSGKQNLKDALISLAPSFSATTNGYGGQNTVVKSAGLRGLAAGDTLVLINGRRRHGTSVISHGGYQGGQSPTDFDLIPTSAVQRIEILRDGASAQYGSDAVAGVINIILKSNAEGGYVSASYGQNAEGVGPHDDKGRNRRLLFNQGFGLGEQGFFSVSGEFEDSKSWNIVGPRKGNIYYLLPDGSRDPREDGDRYRQISGNPEVEKQVVSYNLSYPTDHVEVVSFATAARKDSIGAVNFRDATSTQNLIEVYPDGFLPLYGIEETDYQALFGLRGVLSQEWDWSLDTSYSRNHSKVRLENALSATFGNASPDNPIQGYTAPPTELYNGGFAYSQWVTDFDVRGNIETGWFDAPLGVTFGAGYRKEWFEQIQGEYASWADGGYVFPEGHPRAGGRPSPGGAGTQGYGPDAVINVSRYVSAAYVDLFQEIGKLELGAALRFEDYSDVGDALAGKVSARYNFNDRYGIRATFNNSFKAPTLQQQYFTHANEVWEGALPVSGRPGINNTFVSGPFSPFAAALGAEALEPQKSNNVSVGFTGAPIRNLDFSIDLYQIDIDDRLVLQESGRVAETTQILADAGLIDPQGNYEYVVRYTSNGIDTRTRGADLVVNYVTDFDEWGVVRWTLLHAYNKTTITGTRDVPEAFRDVISPGNFFSRSSLGLYTVAKPEHSTFLTADWVINGLDVKVTAKRYSEVRTLHNTNPARDHVIGTAWVADLDVGYRFSNNLRLSAGGTNIFGRRPEGSSAAQKPFDANEDPSYGYFAPYGAWGAFFYGKLEYTW